MNLRLRIGLFHLLVQAWSTTLSLSVLAPTSPLTEQTPQQNSLLHREARLGSLRRKRGDPHTQTRRWPLVMRGNCTMDENSKHYCAEGCSSATVPQGFHQPLQLWLHLVKLRSRLGLVFVSGCQRVRHLQTVIRRRMASLPDKITRRNTGCSAGEEQMHLVYRK